jgi:DNA-binding response OmpR family regulator
MIISARADEASIDRGLAVGADDYVTKPFSPGDMVRRLSALLDVASGDPLGGSAATRGSLT